MAPSHSKGDIVYCERCLQDLFILNQDIISGEALKATQFTPIPPQTIDIHLPVKCIHCSYGGIISPPIVRKP